jgi:hypothetical protein
MDRAPDGTFWVAWQQNPDKEGDDLFLRHLDSDLKPLGNEIRATDYQGERGKAPRAISSALSVSSANLFIAYTLEREKQHLIERMRVGLSPDLTTGLQGSSRTSRELGDTAVVNEERMGGEYPDISCTKDACFLVWHETEKGAEKGGGAAGALIDPVKGTLLWRKRFHGTHPAVASTAEGQAEVAFYEGGRVRVAAVSRDGFGAVTTFARVTGDAPRPWITPGRNRGEWLVSWLDVEAGHTEAFVARLQCR